MWLGSQTPAKPVCGRHVAGTVVLQTCLELSHARWLTGREVFQQQVGRLQVPVDHRLRDGQEGISLTPLCTSFPWPFHCLSWTIHCLSLTFDCLLTPPPDEIARNFGMDFSHGYRHRDEWIISLTRSKPFGGPCRYCIACEHVLNSQLHSGLSIGIAAVSYDVTSPSPYSYHSLSAYSCSRDSP